MNHALGMATGRGEGREGGNGGVREEKEKYIKEREIHKGKRNT